MSSSLLTLTTWLHSLSSLLLYFLQSHPCFAIGDCANMSRLNLHRLQPRCESDTPTDHRLTCVNVLDLDPTTMWTPRYPLTRKHFILISFNEAVKLTRIELLQYSWKLGHAKFAEVYLDESDAKYRVRLGPPDTWSQIILPEGVETTSVKFHFLLDSNSTFGGVREISFFGCMAKGKVGLEIDMSNYSVRSNFAYITGPMILLLILFLIAGVVGITFLFQRRKRLRNGVLGDMNGNNSSLQNNDSERQLVVKD